MGRTWKSANINFEWNMKIFLKNSMENSERFNLLVSLMPKKKKILSYFIRNFSFCLNSYFTVSHFLIYVYWWAHCLKTFELNMFIHSNPLPLLRHHLFILCSVIAFKSKREATIIFVKVILLILFNSWIMKNTKLLVWEMEV